MNKLFRFVVFAFLVLSFKSTVFADVTLDESNISDGVIGVKYSGNFNKPIKITIEKDNVRYVYTVKDNKSNYVPLQMGSGSYKVSLMENIDGVKYRALSVEIISVEKIHPTNIYTYPTLITNYSSSMKSITGYGKIIENLATDNKISTVYKDVIANYRYDDAKISGLSSDYVPMIDDMYTTKKGICYDYASLMAGVLRSQKIPTKLMMGYAPEIKEYHAWNEIYIDGKWNVVDTTYDAAMTQAGYSVSFAKDASKFKVLKFY